MTKVYHIKHKSILAYNLISGLQETDIEFLTQWLANKTQFGEKIYQVIVNAGLSEITFEDRIVDNKQTNANLRECNMSWLPGSNSIQNTGDFILFNEAGAEKGCIYNKLPSDNLVLNKKPYDILFNWRSKNPYTEISEIKSFCRDLEQSIIYDIAIPNKKPLEQLKLVNELFYDFGHKGITKFEVIIERFNISKLNLILGLNHDGLFKIGVKVFKPSRELQLFLISFSKGQSDEKHAMLEGILEADSPSYLTFCMYSDKWDTEICYDIN